jgi:hypothetical protein
MTTDLFPRHLTAGIVLAAAWVGSMPQPAHARSPEQWIENFSEHWRDDGWGPPPYMRAADDDGWHARMRALQGLVAAGRPAIKPLLRVLEHGDPHQRMLAAQALGYLAPHVPSEPLLRAIRNDPDAAVRLYAVDALARQGRDDIAAPLAELEKSETNRDVKKHIAYALERKGSQIEAQIVGDLRTWDADRIDSAHLGKVAPDFRLPSLAGETIRLSDFRGQKPVVLVFIYGDT